VPGGSPDVEILSAPDYVGSFYLSECTVPRFSCASGIMRMFRYILYDETKKPTAVEHSGSPPRDSDAFWKTLPGEHVGNTK
jgi:hypothetical protein